MRHMAKYLIGEMQNFANFKIYFAKFCREKYFKEAPLITAATYIRVRRDYVGNL